MVLVCHVSAWALLGLKHKLEPWFQINFNLPPTILFLLNENSYKHKRQQVQKVIVLYTKNRSTLHFPCSTCGFHQQVRRHP